MNKKIFLFLAIILLAFAGLVNASYYQDYSGDNYYQNYGNNYYQDYGYPYDYGYDDYSYPYYSGYYPYNYYTNYPYYEPYTSFYLYYEETQYQQQTYQPPQPQYCANPYGAENQKKCFNSALNICKNGNWLFDSNVQCCQASECQPNQAGDYCYFAKSCSNYQCTTGYQQFCPAPGTSKNGICYYGASSGQCNPVSGSSAVDIMNLAFNPATITVQAGSTITWTNHDSVQHTVTSDNGVFDSGTLNPGQTYSQTFSNVGTYAYHCSIHPFMHGTIQVVSGTNCIGGATSDRCSSSGCLLSKCMLQSNQQCDATQGCIGGAVSCNTNDCNSRDGFYGDRFCKSGDVYQQYRNYYCSGSSCIYSSEDRLRESCNDGCSNGQCTGITECNVDVNIDNLAFSPSSITVPPGTSVRWTNNDNVQHTVTSNTGIFNSGILNIGGVYTRTFSSTGTFNYHCELHPSMTGTVRVVSGATCPGGGGITCPNKCVSDVWNYNGYYSNGCQYSTQNCNSLDSELGARFCKDGDVYVRYRDSFCSQSYGGCDSNIFEKKIQDCSGSCQNGQCTGALPVACESRCDQWSDWTKIDGQMERRQTCYSYTIADGSCILSKTYTVIQHTPVEQVTPSVEKEKSFEFSFDISQKREDTTMQHGITHLYNGLLFGSNDIRFSVKNGTHVGRLSFYVDGKNDYGNLVVFVDGDIIKNNIITKNDIIYNENPSVGRVEIDVNRDMSSDGTIIIKVSSSSWRIWAPATYDISDISLAVTSYIIKKDSFDFEFYQDEYDGFTHGTIQITPQDGFDIFLNGRKLSDGKINKGDLKVGVNTFEFIPLPGRSYKGKAVVSVFYRSS